MGSPERLHYRISLTGRSARSHPAPPFVIRSPAPDDADRLAELMLDSYLGTVDYEGEGIDEAKAEIADYLDGEAMLEASWVVEDGQLLLAAILISLWEGRPLVGYVMTRASAKSQGVAALLLEMSIHNLRREGWETLDGFITSGNTPSERLFASAGAVQVD
jgi:GNAT superfamily N-acetyltransferase